jgi:hypothetical protein
MLLTGLEDSKYAFKTLGEEITVMTKVVIIMSCRLKQRQSSVWLVERSKSKEKEAYALALILLLNPGEAKTESDSTKAS